MVKLTKKDKYAMLLEVLAGAEVEVSEKEMLTEFVNKEVEAIDKKAEKAKGRTREKKEDLMKNAVLAALSADEARLGGDVLADVLVDFEDATQAKVTARLSALVKEGLAVKDQVTVEGRRLVTYKLA